MQTSFASVAPRQYLLDAFHNVMKSGILDIEAEDDIMRLLCQERLVLLPDHEPRGQLHFHKKRIIEEKMLDSRAPRI